MDIKLKILLREELNDSLKVERKQKIMMQLLLRMPGKYQNLTKKNMKMYEVIVIR